MQQAVVYLLKIRPKLSSLLASYNLTCHSIGTTDDSNELRHRWTQQRGALMTGLTTIQANFIVVIEAQRKRPAPETTLFQLCAYYLAFLDFALHSFQRGQQLLLAFPDLPRSGIKESRIQELPSLASQTTSVSITVISEKERTNLIADVTTIKLCRSTVKLLNNHLSSRYTAANRISRLLSIVQATVSRHRASREHGDSTWSEWRIDTPHEYTQANNAPRNEEKSPWIRVCLAPVAKMFRTLLFALLFHLVFGTDVIPLTKKTRSELSKHPVALVKYYAPWCGRCKELAPHYEEAAAELKIKEPSVPLFEVNCDEETDMCNEAGIKGYPTLKVYNYGEYAEEFDEGRTTENIVNFMVLRSGPPATEILDESRYKELFEGEDYIVSLQSKKSDEIDEFEKLARKLRKFFKFVYTKSSFLSSSKDSLIQLSLPKQLETKLEDRSKTYDGPLKSADIEQWIRKNAVGTAGIRDKKMKEFFKKPLLVVYTQINFERNPSNVRYHRNRLISVAKDTKSELQFALSDTSAFSDELYEMGLTANDEGAMVIIMGENGKNYLMSDKFGVSELKKFVSDFAAGSLEPYIKSEPIPEKQEGSVMKVVGRTFEKVVLDESKDVLVEFYAPWCGHCEALKPKYEELAKKLSKEKDVIVAAVDATANSFPPAFDVQGYPTIYWVPKASKDKPIPYKGGREVDDMLKFVAKSATDELIHYTRDGQLKQEEL
uniref:Protein disulfide-isomerase n=1 Tax=Echinococcus granulosus TaxID=6210 RepID=A0A068WIL3_ECHGR|nr:protein disulfide isomerase A3 [Echinococcus granulosus]